jgi:chaperonin GroES
MKGGKTMLRPIGNKVIIEKVEAEQQTTGGIIIPDNAKEKPNQGKVVAVGNGSLDQNGNRISIDCKEGDIVCYAKYSGTEVKINNKEYIVIEEKDILFVI